MEPDRAMNRLSVFMVVLGAALILTMPFAFDARPAGSSGVSFSPSR